MSRDDTPTLDFGGRDTFLAEGVFAVIQIKSTLTREKLAEDLRALDRVKSLVPTGSPAITTGLFLNRPLRCIFAQDGATSETLREEISKAENLEIPDIVSVLSRGAILSREHQVTWEPNTPFMEIQGKAAALGWLYFLLASYAGSFIGRSVNSVPYFEPLSNWRDVEETAQSPSA